MTWDIYVLCLIINLRNPILTKCVNFPLLNLDKFRYVPMLIIQVHELNPYQLLLECYIILYQVLFVERQFSMNICTLMWFLSKWGFIWGFLAKGIGRVG